MLVVRCQYFIEVPNIIKLSVLGVINWNSFVIEYDD